MTYTRFGVSVTLQREFGFPMMGIGMSSERYRRRAHDRSLPVVTMDVVTNADDHSLTSDAMLRQSVLIAVPKSHTDFHVPGDHHRID